jgi:VWFA-related protein
MKPAKLRLRIKTRSGGAIHTSRRAYLGIGLLLCSIFFTQQSGGESKPSPQASSPQAQEIARPTAPMLDEGKGIIHLDVSVTNADGEPASGLTREDFELLDEGHPQKILSFHVFNGESIRSNPMALQVILFVDTLGISKEQASRVQLEVEQFLRQNGGLLTQPVSIFGLSEDGLWTVSNHDSTDGNSLASDLSPEKRTVLNRQPDALHALGFIVAGQRRKSGRKVLLWIGPGCGAATDMPSANSAFRPTTGLFPAPGNGGQKTFDQIYWLTTLFREARLSIEEISVDQVAPCTNGYQQYLGGVRTARDADQRFLYKKVLAIQSGGSVVDDGQDLVAAMNRCVRRALNFYTFSFDPPVTAQPQEYHSLKLLVNRPGLLARTNTGYYDEPLYTDQPNPTLRPVSVEQLGRLLSETDDPRNLFGSSVATFKHLSGGDEWAPLSKVELTERLSLERLSDWTAQHRDPSLQQVLIGVADASVFLDPPPAEIPNRVTPDDAAQQHMLLLVKDYLEESIPKLPNFVATRTTVRYEDEARLAEGSGKADYQRLHAVETSKATVLYRAGDEVVESQVSKPDEPSNSYLITHGTFGPLLAGVRLAVETQGRMKWLRWESGPKESRAVFGFEVPAAESRYFEGGCCVPDAEGKNSFRIQAGYRGEIAVDPDTGTILRLQMQFDVHDYVPVDRDEILIDYRPVKIGGKFYVCPVRSVAIGRARSVVPLKAGDLSFLSWGPYSTEINDMRFSDYHIFRAKTRLLTDFNPDK